MKFTANPVVVDAWRITARSASNGAGQDIEITLEDGTTREITPAMYVRHLPQIGDYFVVQEDGYEYINPRDVFTRKYGPKLSDGPLSEGPRTMAFSPGQPVHTVLLPDGSRLIVPCETGQVSDGFHTYSQLYSHRFALFIALCRAIVGTKAVSVWRSKLQSDGTMYEGWFIAGLNTEPGAQISYHLPLSQWDACGFIPERSSAPPFDGHTSDDVVERLNALFA